MKSLSKQRTQTTGAPQIQPSVLWTCWHCPEFFAIRVEDLARRVGLSTSSFHQWFRNITGMSPLQYQKQLRLQEARNILRSERKDGKQAAHGARRFLENPLGMLGPELNQRADETVVKSSLVLFRARRAWNGGNLPVQNCDRSYHHR
jgi:AraC-like DNA-binding protein